MGSRRSLKLELNPRVRLVDPATTKTLRIRIGQGVDLHRFCPGRKLVLGGVEVPYEFGLEGHSDADVIVHALMDALLGAIGSRDIGHHFPNTDARYSGVRSIDLLRKVMALVAGEGWQVMNCDISVLAEAPKLEPYVEEMRHTMGSALEIDRACVGLKVTTAEKLGAIGRGEGIMALAVVLLGPAD